jgi:hypothetical protein
MRLIDEYDKAQDAATHVFDKSIGSPSVPSHSRLFQLIPSPFISVFKEREVTTARRLIDHPNSRVPVLTPLKLESYATCITWKRRADDAVPSPTGYRSSRE